LHTEVGAFGESQVALLRTFADQAVIAIENVRLFTELQTSNRELRTALDKQTATGDILRVISQSPTEVGPVFQAVVTSAIRLARGHFGGISLLRSDAFHLEASQGLEEGLRTFQRIFPLPLDQSGLMKIAVTTRRAAHKANVFEDPRTGPFAQQLASAARYHAFIHVLLVRGEVVLGVLTVMKSEAGPFASGEIALLETFADQAVIAIENVRLFTELQEKNQALTQAHAQISESLEQQTATSEILRVISSSTTDVQPVFDAIVRSAQHLLNGLTAMMTRLVGDEVHLAAVTSAIETVRMRIETFFPRPVAGTGHLEHVVRHRVPYA